VPMARILSDMSRQGSFFTKEFESLRRHIPKKGGLLLLGSVNGASEESIINHIRGTHNIDINKGNSHYAHCHDCEKSNGHGRRLSSFGNMLVHLEVF